MLGLLRRAGVLVAGLIFIATLSLIIALLFNGVAAVTAFALPILWEVCGFVTTIGLPVLGVLSFFRATRHGAGQGFRACGYIYGTATYWWTFLLLLGYWGWLGIIVSVMAWTGIGVVPVAMLAAALHADWAIVGQVLFAIIVCGGCMLYGDFLKRASPDAPP